MSRRARTVEVVAVGVLVAVCAACDELQSEPFPITVVARTDNRPLAGVEVTVNALPVGRTGESGELRLALLGHDGDPVSYRVRCPAGHRQPEDAPPVVLRRFSGLDPESTARGVTVAVQCPPSERTAVIVVRSAANLPVRMHGVEVARTDDAGVAHMLLHAAPDTSLSVLIDTTSNPLWRPQNPVSTFVLGDSDEVFVADHPLALAEQPALPRNARPPRAAPSVPVRLR